MNAAPQYREARKRELEAEIELIKHEIELQKLKNELARLQKEGIAEEFSAPRKINLDPVVTPVPPCQDGLPSAPLYPPSLPWYESGWLKNSKWTSWCKNKKGER